MEVIESWARRLQKLLWCLQVGKRQLSTQLVTTEVERATLPAQPVHGSVVPVQEGMGLNSGDLCPMLICVLECCRGKMKSCSSDSFANGHAFNGGFKIS